MLPFGGPPGFTPIVSIPSNTVPQTAYLQPQVLMPSLQRSFLVMGAHAPIQMAPASSVSPIPTLPRPMLVAPQVAAEINAAGVGLHRSPSTGSPTSANNEVWSEHVASDGRVYYYNKITKQSSWLKPDELKTPEEKKSAMQKLWREYKTAEGRPYYYNIETKETTWICPKDFESSASKGKGNKTEQKSSNSSGETEIEKAMMATLRSLEKPIKSVDEKEKSESAEHGNDEIDEEKEVKKRQGDTFKELLRDKYNEGKISSVCSWEHAVKYIQHDNRFRVLNKVSEKKQLFNAWKVQRQKEERDEKRIAIKKAKENLENWLQNHPKVRPTLRYSKAETMFVEEPTWKAVHESERKEIFRDALELIEKREKDNAKAVRRRNVQALADILEGMEEITYKTTWAQAQRLLIENPSFANDLTLQSMDKEDALIVFEEHIRTAEKHYLKEKDMEDKRRRRQERKVREAFQAFLVELHKRGELTSISLWCELYPVISADVRFDNMLKQSGSTPLDLFKFYVEDLKCQYTQDRRVIKEILKERNITVGPDTSFDQLCKWISSDERGKNVDPGNMKLCYHSLLEKAEAKIKEQEREEARKKKRSETSFRNILRGLVPPLEPTSAWEVVRPKIEDEDAFVGVENEESREKIFNGYIQSLAEACGHHHSSSKKKKKDKKKKRSKEEVSDSDVEVKPKKSKKKHRKTEVSDEEKEKKRRKKSRKRSRSASQSKPSTVKPVVRSSNFQFDSNESDLSEGELEKRRKELLNKLDSTPTSH